MNNSNSIFRNIGVTLALMTASSRMSRKIIGKGATACLLLIFVASSFATASDVGIYYFPGWYSKSKYWKDLKGVPGSRSPNVAWPAREPLLGFYAEEGIKVAEQHIEWARQYGVTFFAYDWYWDGKLTSSNHAVDNFIKASNNSKLRFSLLWANHSEVPRNLKEI